MNRAKTTTILAALTLSAACGTAQVSFDLQNPELSWDAAAGHVLAVGSTTPLQVSFSDNDTRTIDVQSDNASFVQGGTFEFRATHCPQLNCLGMAPLQVLQLHPTHAGLVRLQLVESGQQLDAITLEAREPETLVVKLSDQADAPFVLESGHVKVPRGIEVRVRCQLLDKAGAPLYAQGPFSVTSIGGGGIFTPEATWVDGYGPGPVTYTAEFRGLTTTFVIDFE